MSHSNLAAIWKSLSVFIGLGAVGLFGWSGAAHAEPCILGPGELEVLSDACEVPLTVKGPVVVNLQKHTIACSLDENNALPKDSVGIIVEGSGATVRNGRIVNCETGVRVEGGGGHLLERLTVRSLPGTSGGKFGFEGKSDGNTFVRNIVKDFAGEGYRLDGSSSNVLLRNKAFRTGDHGFEARNGSSGNLFLWNEATQNAKDGFRSKDTDSNYNYFFHNVANRNGDAGIQIRSGSNDNRLLENTTKGNGFGDACDIDGDGGIHVKAGSSANLIKYNKSRHNCIGVVIEGPDGDVAGATSNIIIDNLSRNNEIDMKDGNGDCDENTWFDNKFKTSDADAACIQ
jgi:hypothetical protein